MTVAYNDRTLPLALHASNPDLTTGLNVSWDFTDFDASNANGVPWISPAAATLTKALTIDLVTRNGLPGRQLKVDESFYKLANIASTGIQTGTGDFTVAIVVSMPATTPSVSLRKGYLFELYGGGSPSFFVEVGDVNGVGSYVSMSAGGGSLVGTSAPYYLQAGRTYIITARRSGNTFSLHQYDLTTSTYKLQGSATSTVSLTNANATDLYCAWTKDASADHVVHSITHWTVALSDATIQTTLADYWSMNANSAGASTLSVTTPANGATIGSTASISGISAGTAPTGIEVQFNGSAWTPLSSFSFNAGDNSWSGVVSGLAAGTGTFVARKTNEPATLAAAIAGVTVSSDSITLASVDAWRVYQRNIVTNTANIALSGTYVGVVTSVEWRFGAGAWTAVTGATIASGNWSGTATGVPVGSGALQVRVGNNTAVMASVAGVGVGDVWICSGQSNMQGRGSSANAYTPSNGIAASKFTSGAWADLTDPYDAGSSGAGSYIPFLATKMLAAGVPVAFVGCAEGGTAISQWQKGGTYYTRMLSRFTAAGGAARGMLFHQGETDVQNGVSTATYQAALEQMINDWFNDTGMPTVVFRVHEGGTGTVAQHDAIREAQTLVGTNNANAVLGPDLYGIEATDVHFLTTVKLQQVADRAWPCIASEFYSMRKTSVTLVNKNGVPRANLRNLRYAFFDQATPATMAAPTAAGGAVGLGLVADQNGLVKIPLQNSTLAAGQTGFLVLSDTTGNAAAASNAYAAPVVVS